eukprot:13830572-Alexandrium_andersonii.AAC.1
MTYSLPAGFAATGCAWYHSCERSWAMRELAVEACFVYDEMAQFALCGPQPLLGPYRTFLLRSRPASTLPAKTINSITGLIYGMPGDCPVIARGLPGDCRGPASNDVKRTC